jgi:methyltransferase (TIGR00027 family)
MKETPVVPPGGITGVASTALWTAAARARETRRPDRLFDDPFADQLAGHEGVLLLDHFHTSRAAPEGNPFLPIRTRWFDTFLRSCVGPGDQVVAVGSGLDTRVYRMDWPEDVVLFELDQEQLLSYKRDRLRQTPARARCEHRQVPADVTGRWEHALLRAGFDPMRRTVWFAEGLLFYLPEEAARDLLERALAVSGPGSRLAADLIGTGVFRLPYTRPFLRRLAEAGCPWLFGTDDPAGFVTSCGWQVDESTEPGRPGARFGRWPEGASPGNISLLPRSYLLSASTSA